MSETASPAPSSGAHHQSFWLWVMCLTGVDYFSTLAYQPSIGFEATGKLAPLATVILIAVTLGGALPVYLYVAGQSPGGQGSIGMLEKLVRGWPGKFLILSLLGFAATDFVITKTLSAADATVHLMENPTWPISVQHIGQARQQLWLTFLLLVLLAAMFLRGFREVIGLAVVLVGIYLALNVLVIGSGIVHLVSHPERFSAWLADVTRGPEGWYMTETPPVSGMGWGAIAVVCLLVFPKLALGLSGFETGVAVMPLVKGKQGVPSQEDLKARIRNTRKLLITAALIMTVMLLG